MGSCENDSTCKNLYDFYSILLNGLPRENVVDAIWKRLNTVCELRDAFYNEDLEVCNRILKSNYSSFRTFEFEWFAGRYTNRPFKCEDPKLAEILRDLTLTYYDTTFRYDNLDESSDPCMSFLGSPDSKQFIEEGITFTGTIIAKRIANKPIILENKKLFKIKESLNEDNTHEIIYIYQDMITQKFGLININEGTIILEACFHQIIWHEFPKSKYLIYYTDKKSGFIDLKGNIIVKDKYDFVFTCFHDYAQFQPFVGFYEGYYIVENEDLFGLIDFDLQELLPCKYKYIECKCVNGNNWEESNMNLYYRVTDIDNQQYLYYPNHSEKDLQLLSKK